MMLRRTSFLFFASSFWRRSTRWPLDGTRTAMDSGPSPTPMASGLSKPIRRHRGIAGLNTMSRHLKVVAMVAVIAFQSIGCFAPAEPTPIPTATPDIGAMVKAAIAALDGTEPPTPVPAPTAVPTYTPFSTPTRRPTNTPIVATLVPTPTPIPDRLPAVECNHPCDHDYEPAQDYVEWESRPSVSSTGVLTLLARVDAGIDFIFPNAAGGSYSNIALTSGSHDLLGSIVPPSRPGWHWTPEPGLWIASEYRYFNNTLLVRAQIDPAAATHPGLRLCLWSGGETDEQNRILDCVLVGQP